ncbi:MAG: UDP-N-acetylglucosamine 1-carboxyvinyltransferase [Patescibacteria group bacterium]|nr:UDP-N-acetylglucosamine 1-carboxyvinyltransferase [Patescibacteria group bacterium]
MSESFEIKGGKKLKGKVQISGSKNSALVLMAASILTDEDVALHNVPDLLDIHTSIELLEKLGKKIEFVENRLVIQQTKNISTEAPYDLVNKMRASIIVLGPLLAKYKKCKVSLPGGCAFGPRPVDLHIMGMKKLGAKIKLDHGYIDAETSGLVGAQIFLAGKFGPSVLGTDNVMMAATLATGETIIDSAAMEPEGVDLANMLEKMGAKIEGIGTSTLKITGVAKLNGVEYTVIPDRIETGTFLIAGILIGENLTIENCNPEHLAYPIELLKNMGAKIEIKKDSIIVSKSENLKPFTVSTSPYPFLATDLQPFFTVLGCVIAGTSSISEGIYPDRFQYTSELARMGADIKIEGNTAVIKGVEKLTGAEVMASDLRAGAALVLAGLIADGKTVVDRIYHIDRGYEKLEEKLSVLGADIKRVEK